MRKMYCHLKFSDVQSYLHSGNVVFRTDETNVDKIRTKIECQILSDYGFEVKIFIRGKIDLAKIIKNNPFLSYKDVDFSKLYVVFLDRLIC